ncbi:MAG: signal peptidase I [Acidobacteriota bacterium]|nr:signal peptidase I [Acidobacteriota bacterium]
MSRTIAEWVFNFVLLVFATGMVAQPFVIPSGSMETTLMTGDHVIVDKLAYAPGGGFGLLPYQDVQRGDIIVFRYPPDIRQNYVKRAIGIPGDRIRIENKRVYRNGELLREPYARHIFPNHDPRRDEMAGITVPPGMYFAMGDNRDNSEDSRYWGFVPRENIVGKPVVVLWSYDAPTEDLTGYTLHHAVDVAEHFFTRTRWSRTLMLVRPDDL